MRRQTIWGVMLLAVTPLGTLGQPPDNETYAPEALTMGVFLSDLGVDNIMSYETGEGLWSGFEVDIMKQLVLSLLGDIDITMVRMPDLDSRIAALQDGSVDFVIGEFAVTPERLELVDFAQPYYYSTGGVLFGKGGCPPGIESWEDLNGTVVVIRDGYYAEDDIWALGMIPVSVNTTGEGGKMVDNGEAVGFIDSIVLPHTREGLTPCDKLEPLWRVPAGVAVAKGNKPLRDLLSKALLTLALGGDKAPLLQMEKDSFIAMGFPPNKDLADLVRDPTATSFLNPGFDD